MRIVSQLLAAALVLGAGAATATASDFNPLGVYVGAAVGESNVRNNGFYASDYYGSDNRATAWQLSLGIRPIAPFGLEYDYMNFGNAKSSSGGYYDSANGSTTAHAVFALGYLPIPLPLVDLYGKLGVARLNSDTTNYGPLFSVRQTIANSDLAYGVGAQAKFGGLAVRVEYARINDRNGDPDLLSAGITWTF